MEMTTLGTKRAARSQAKRTRAKLREAAAARHGHARTEKAGGVAAPELGEGRQTSNALHEHDARAAGHPNEVGRAQKGMHVCVSEGRAQRSCADTWPSLTHPRVRGVGPGPGATGRIENELDGGPRAT